jgi:hypothetical protein
MSLGEVLFAAKDALVGLGKLLAYVHPSKENTDETLKEVIHQARADATHKSHELHKQVELVREELRRIGVDLDLPEQQATAKFLESAGWWGRYRLRRAVDRLLSLRDELSRLTSDMESILICSKRTKALVDGSRTGSEIQHLLDELAFKGASMSEQFRFIIAVLEGFLKNA